MKPRHVTFVAGTLDVGGAETQLVLMCRALLAGGHRVDVLALEDGPNRARLGDLGVEVILLTDGSGPRRRIPELLRRVRANRPDVLQASHNWVNAYVGIVGRLLRVTTVGAIRSNPTRMQRTRPLRHPALVLPPLIASNSLTNIEAARALGVSPKRLVHLPNAVDTDRFRPGDADSGDRPHVLGVGRMVDWKRFDIWLEIVHRLAAERDGRLRGTLVGYGPLEDELRARADELGLAGIVEFVQTADPLPHYQAADLFLFTSTDNEGMPNVVLEALSCGLPVASFALGDARHVVLAETTGLLADDLDVDGLTAAADRILSEEDLAARLRAGARDLMTAEWSVDALLHNLDRVHETAATPRRSR
ncbi:MAG: glycosyltransferase [Actinomycetota bacterium]